MSRPLTIEWHESASELYQIYRRESNGEVKARLHALWHLCRGKREVEVAELVGVAARTVRRWVSWYRSVGLPSVRR